MTHWIRVAVALALLAGVIYFTGEYLALQRSIDNRIVSVARSDTATPRTVSELFVDMRKLMFLQILVFAGWPLAVHGLVKSLPGMHLDLQGIAPRAGPPE